ncbi:PucR family transcriptional regulator [Saccharopolyspora sp. 5N102]|uniref:PucR family transcriptional regulator n=1 Tax=Saccharopolyspora sp. 5N102 TaxID=3375155 RepID=UPI0037B9EBE4
MPREQNSGAGRGPVSDSGRAVALVKESLEDLVAAAADAVWKQVPAYRKSPDPDLRDELGAHIEAVFRTLVACLEEGRPATRQDFPSTGEYAARRVRQGVSLSDFLRAFRISQGTLWKGVLDAARSDSRMREAALEIVAELMRVIEVGSSVAGEAYLAAQQHQLADADRVARDLLEDLISGRAVPAGPKQDVLRAAGLDRGVSFVVATATPVSALPEDLHLRDVVSIVRGAGKALTVMRQDEVVSIAPVTGDVRPAIDAFETTLTELSRRGVGLSLGISTVHAGLGDVPGAYSEARLARENLGGTSGVVALPRLSTFDYLMLRDDPIALRLIRPELRSFVEEDAAKGSALVETLLEYAASDLNAKVAAQRLHVHVNTAYYRLERIAERTGRDLRRVADVIELLIAVRLLAQRTPANSS